jgi:phasin family protein
MKGSSSDDNDSLPFGKFAALMRYRGLDPETWLEAYRGHMEQLMAARAAMLKGVEDVSSSQLDISRSAMDRLMREMPTLAQNGRFDEIARLQTEIAAKVMDAMMANMRGFSAVITRSNMDLLQIMGNAMDQAFKSVAEKNGKK